MTDSQSGAGDRPRPDSGAHARYGYFIVRIRRPDGDGPGDVSGLVERLGTGERRAFRSSDELAQIVDEWSQPPRAT